MFGIPEAGDEKLNKLDFVWDTQEFQWDEGFYKLLKFHQREGHCKVPSGHTEEGFKLGNWVAGRRRDGSEMPHEQLEMLQELGFIWGPFAEQWEEGFGKLKLFQLREGHCLVPDIHKENDYNLGKWVGKQRGKQSRLTLEQRERLESLGFIWDVPLERWEEGYKKLRQFKSREGNCLAPVSHIEDSHKLGSWVRTQRARKASLSLERIERLEALGFVWDTRTGNN